MRKAPEHLLRYDPVMAVVRENLKRIRESRGVFQCEVAAHLGISQPHYSRIEGSKDKRKSCLKEITFREVLGICEHFGVTIDDLFEGSKQFELIGYDVDFVATIEAAKAIIYSQMIALREAEARIAQLEAELETEDV